MNHLLSIDPLSLRADMNIHRRLTALTPPRQPTFGRFGIRNRSIWRRKRRGCPGPKAMKGSRRHQSAVRPSWHRLQRSIREFRYSSLSRLDSTRTVAHNLCLLAFVVTRISFSRTHARTALISLQCIIVSLSPRSSLAPFVVSPLPPPLSPPRSRHQAVVYRFKLKHQHTRL